MKNYTLNADLKKITESKNDLVITKGTIGGTSIEVFNKATNEDFGSYIYASRVTDRDADYNKLTNLINGKDE